MNSEKTSRGYHSSVICRGARAILFWLASSRAGAVERLAGVLPAISFFSAGAEAGPQVVAISDGTSKTSRTGA